MLPERFFYTSMTRDPIRNGDLYVVVRTDLFNSHSLVLTKVLSSKRKASMFSDATWYGFRVKKLFNIIG